MKHAYWIEPFSFTSPQLEVKMTGSVGQTEKGRMRRLEENEDPRLKYPLVATLPDPPVWCEAYRIIHIV